MRPILSTADMWNQRARSGPTTRPPGRLLTSGPRGLSTGTAEGSTYSAMATGGPASSAGTTG
jgi:hypothetical protein